MNEASINGYTPRYQGRTIREYYVSAFVALADFSLIAVLGILTYAIYPGYQAATFHLYASASVTGAVISVTAFHLAHLYRVETLLPKPKILKQLAKVSVSSFLFLLFIGFILQVSHSFSQIWFAGWVLSAFSGVLLLRLVALKIIVNLAQNRYLERKIAVIGTGEQAAAMLKRLRSGAYPWIYVIGVFNDDDKDPGYPVAGHLVLGGVDDLITYARNNSIDDIVLALPWSSESYIRGLINRLSVLPTHISLSPDLAGLSLGRSFDAAYSPDLPTLTVLKRPIDGWHSVVKFLEDKILGTLLLVLISPIMLLVAIAIKIDSSGPVFFKQKRLGFNNQLIEVYKFRSMYAEKTDADASKLATRDDPRITRVGRFLRRTSLDELPQFINVLKGDMSIVGPRPHALKASAAGRLYHEVVNDYAKRHRVKPGITGWAQINGWRGETDTEEKIIKRVEYDLVYIENWSLTFDLKIILSTVFGGFTGKNTY
ncbi:MAG: undecaprenyl-phosphate glucose phosphotransferase [Thiotrichales bacterium]